MFITVFKKKIYPWLEHSSGQIDANERTETWVQVKSQFYNTKKKFYNNTKNVL